jgi:hypothetical protein
MPPRISIATAIILVQCLSFCLQGLSQSPQLADGQPLASRADATPKSTIPNGIAGVEPSSDDATVPSDHWFDQNVLPILESRCYGCHSHATEMSGNLALDFASGWKTGGDRGPTIQPGDPDASLLLQAVLGNDTGLRMPPEEPLPADEIAILRKWIADGAIDPRITPPPQTPAGPWWSLQPLATSTASTQDPRTDTHSANPIDRWIERQLEPSGLTKTPRADRRTLLKRWTLDLHGLLPTPEEWHQFENDTSPDAFEKVVDRLLASPRYGERWARHWFDWIHFADSHGYEHDVMRMEAWRYRDYTIDALNADMGWAEWVRQQIAVDAYHPERSDWIPALGFLAAGPWDQSTAATAQTTFDYQDRDDMVTQIMSVLTSTTVHCARCHHHKFDPISQDDYYALQAVLAGVGRGNVPFDTDHAVQQQREQAADWLRRAAAREESFLTGTLATDSVAHWEKNSGSRRIAWEPIQPSMLIAIDGTQLDLQTDLAVVAKGPKPERETILVVSEPGVKTISALRLDLLRDDALPMGGPGRCDNGNLHLSELVIEVTRQGSATATPIKFARSLSDFDQDGWTVAHAIDGDPKTAWGIHPQVGQDHTAIFALETPLQTQAGDRLSIHLRQLHGGFHTLGRFRCSTTDASPSEWSLVPSSIQTILAVEPLQRSTAQRIDLAAMVMKSHAEAVLRTLPQPNWVYAASSNFRPLPQSEFYVPWASPKSVFVLRRGNIETPETQSSPGALSCLSHAPSRFSLPESHRESDRRRALAEWITHPENPLFWRSIVNRVWLQHFGQGIVDTPNDFGRMGSQPSHPELLDELALEFQHAQGSLKWLHRLMLLSEAYQRSAAAPSSSEFLASVATDPDNRKRWRGNRRRLDAESFRDSLLHLASTLDHEMRGPAVQWFRLGPAIQVTPSVDYANFDWTQRAAHRRAIYRFVYRGQQDPFMELLDFPDAAQLTPSRSLTASPLQALALWNHEFVLNACEELATAIRSQASMARQQVETAYRLLLLRPPSPSELDEASAFLERHSLPAFVRVLVNSHEFIYCE